MKEVTLETERLILRPLTIEDAEDAFELDGRRESNKVYVLSET